MKILKFSLLTLALGLSPYIWSFAQTDSALGQWTKVTEDGQEVTVKYGNDLITLTPTQITHHNQKTGKKTVMWTRDSIRHDTLSYDFGERKVTVYPSGKTVVYNIQTGRKNQIFGPLITHSFQRNGTTSSRTTTHEETTQTASSKKGKQTSTTSTTAHRIQTTTDKDGNVVTTIEEAEGSNFPDGSSVKIVTLGQGDSTRNYNQEELDAIITQAEKTLKETEKTLQEINQGEQWFSSNNDGSVQIIQSNDNPERWELRQNMREVRDFLLSKEGFRGHWAGFEMGWNALLDKHMSTSLRDEYQPFRLKLPIAFNFNLNFLQYSVPFTSPRFGLVIGMGLGFNIFRFEGDNSFIMDKEQINATTDPMGTGEAPRFSRMVMSKFCVPVLFEYQTGRKGSSWQKFYVSLGAIGQIRMTTKLKTFYHEHQTTTERKSFYARDLNLAATLRLGYGCIHIYANFYPLGLFETGRAPKLYPLELGLVLLRF